MDLRKLRLFAFVFNDYFEADADKYLGLADGEDFFIHSLKDMTNSSV